MARSLFFFLVFIIIPWCQLACLWNFCSYLALPCCKEENRGGNCSYRERSEGGPSQYISGVSRRVFFCCAQQWPGSGWDWTLQTFVNNLSHCWDSHGGVCACFVSHVIYVKWLETAGRIVRSKVCAAVVKWQPEVNLLIRSKSLCLFEGLEYFPPEV